jgi:quercetin dioxygenase-like cupin family protein
MTDESCGGQPALVVVDLGATDTSGHAGVVWSLPHGGDLDVNLVHLAAGGSIGAHVNNDVDVAMSVMTGSGALVVDGVRHDLSVGVFVSIPKGVHREVRAGSGGMTYLSIHRRRGPLAIGVRPADPS